VFFTGIDDGTITGNIENKIVSIFFGNNFQRSIDFLKIKFGLDEIILKLVDTSDETVNLLYNLRKKYRKMFATDFEMTEEKTRNWIKKLILGNPERILFIIYFNNKKIGCIGNGGYDKKNNSSRLDNMMKDPLRNLPGAMTIVEKVYLKWMFDDLKLSKITGFLFSDNSRMIKLHKKCGWITTDVVPIKKISTGKEIRWEEITTKQAMILGTAGFTALMCSFAVRAKEELLLGEKVNNVLVTGATGGVGSIAVMILAKLGYNVTAVTGKSEHNEYLKSIGAKSIINRAEFDKEPRPLDKGLWDCAVDTVGGKILANVLAQTKDGGIVAACGNASDYKLNTTVMPFIIRGVKLWGISSVSTSKKRREFVWNEASKLIDFEKLDQSIKIVSLEEILDVYPKMLKGETAGRYIVDLNK